jgi:exopolysaccharide biosynthesis polyprenyl glycosylphosphotransferase
VAATPLDQAADWSTSTGDRRVRVRVDPATLRRFHVYTDVFLVGAGWLLAWQLRSALTPWLGPINPLETYVSSLPLIVPPWIFCCWLFGIYQSARITTLVDQIQGLLRGVLLGFLVVATIGFLSRELEFGRSVVLMSAGLSLVLQGVSRASYRLVEKRLRSSGRCDVRTLIVGAGTTGTRLLQRIADHPQTGYCVVGFLDDSADLRERGLAGRAVLGALGDLRDVVERERVEEVVIAIPSLEHSRMLSLVLDCEDRDVTFRMVTGLFDVLTTSSHVDLIDDMPLVRLGGRRVWRLYEPIKRILDALGAAVLLALCAPLCAWVALRIALDSSGPILFRQQRVGRHGREFAIWKFRTMQVDVDPYEEAPHAADDPRVTRCGAWLRRSSLDELPQLWNVLRGDMSLVGPRPEMPFIVATYADWQRRRLTVKPGITGLWQILGRKDLPMHDNLQYDFYYIHNRSLLFDLSILIRTVLAVGSKRGAY